MKANLDSRVVVVPDAQFATWRGVAGAVKRAIARPVATPVVPSTRSGGYSGTPLPKKLGIRPGCVVALVGAPDGFAATLGELPAGVTLVTGATARAGVTVWFVRRRSDLVRALAQMPEAASRGPLWIVWPKQASPLAADLAQSFVREHAIASGLVDYKVCAVDADWSGLAFAVKRSR